MLGMGWQELAIIFVIVLIIFGPKSLPKIGQSLGKGIREFKDAAQGLTSGLSDDDDDTRRNSKPAPSSAVPPQQVVQSAPHTVEEDLAADKQSSNHSV